MNSSTYLVPVSEMASSLVKSYICLHRDTMITPLSPVSSYLQAVVLASHSGAVQGCTVLYCTVLYCTVLYCPLLAGSGPGLAQRRGAGLPLPQAPPHPHCLHEALVPGPGPSSRQVDHKPGVWLWILTIFDQLLKVYFVSHCFVEVGSSVFDLKN